MIRRLYQVGGWAAPFTAAELAALQQLVEAHCQLQNAAGEQTNVGSEAAHGACTSFLHRLDEAASALGLQAADRTYRLNFSANYRALFPDGRRRYRTDVFEASADQHAAIWVNGDKFELSVEAISQAEALQQAWACLGRQLTRWRLAGEEPSAKPTRAELIATMNQLDCVWARFENSYVSELISIESQARKLIVRAVEQEAQLQRSALQRGRDSPEHLQAQQNLVATINHLNAVANFQRKGRDDLGADVLEAARRVLRKANAGNTGPPAVIDDASAWASRVLAKDVVDSFEAVRTYLREVSRCLERVDPHLCNNTGLVARLVDWEESWEVGARYVRHAAELEAMNDLVAEIRTAQRLVPALAGMCSDCDAELFLVLPRLLWIFYAAKPERPRKALLKTLLPHRWARSQGGAEEQAPGPELAALVEHFQGAVEVLAQAWASRQGRGAPPQDRQGAAPPSAEALVAAREALMRRAIAGPGAALAGDRATAGAQLEAHLDGFGKKRVEDFARELEKWSLELQRHCAEDWNQCSAVFVQCLTETEKRPPSAAFQV